MAQDTIFAPMGVLALVTFLVLSLIPARRFRAVFAKQVTSEDFKLGESSTVPAHVTLANRAYMNLLELPVLFYVVGLMYFVSGRVDGTVMALAWSYVALRALHSAIHVLYNNVIHRLTAFALSNFVLIALWVVFFLR